MLRATSELLHEVGLRAMTTEEIASRSGASKATIYKWWPNKYAVAIDAFLSEMMADSPDPDTGSARDDLSAWCAGSCTSTPGRADGSSRNWSARRRRDPLIQQELRTHLVDSRRELFRAIWDRGVARGELRGDVDPEAAIDLVIGPALYRLMIGHAPLTEAAADAIVDAAIRGLAEGD